MLKNSRTLYLFLENLKSFQKTPASRYKVSGRYGNMKKLRIHSDGKLFLFISPPLSVCFRRHRYIRTYTTRINLSSIFAFCVFLLLTCYCSTAGNHHAVRIRKKEVVNKVRTNGLARYVVGSCIACIFYFLPRQCKWQKEWKEKDGGNVSKMPWLAREEGKIVDHISRARTSLFTYVYLQQYHNRLLWSSGCGKSSRLKQAVYYCSKRGAYLTTLASTYIQR